MHVNRIILFIINYRRFLMDMEISKQDYLKRYKEELLINEKSKATIEKYVSEVKLLLDFLENHERSKASILEYREA